LIIADEPVSALDVSIQAQVLNLMQDLQKQFNLTYIFIDHDLGVVRHISDRIGVMYLGKMVEMSDAEKLYEETLHPYTQALLTAVTVTDPEFDNDETVLEGDMPISIDPPSGSALHSRCLFKMDVSQKVTPENREVKNAHY